MRTTDTHIYFWGGKNNVFSNFYEVYVLHKGKIFFSSEHAFMYEKAITFGDEKAAKSIRSLRSPRDVKKIGRLVVGFDEAIWDRKKFDVMYNVLYSKFMILGGLRKDLKDTANRILVEASPLDLEWGVGFRENDDRILDERNWFGKNLLGLALMKVRAQMFYEENTLPF